MSVTEILATAQYVVDRGGRQTAVLLDVATWNALRGLLEDLAEDERLAELMRAVAQDEVLEGEDARRAYQQLLAAV